MAELTFAEKVLIATYGRCVQCLAPRNVTSEERDGITYFDLGCTANPEHLAFGSAGRDVQRF